MTAEPITVRDFQCELVWEIRRLLDDVNGDLTLEAADRLHWLKADLESEPSPRRQVRIADEIRAAVRAELASAQIGPGGLQDGR